LVKSIDRLVRIISSTLDMKANAKCCSKITENLFLGNQFSTTIVTDIDVIVSIGCKSKSTLPNIVNQRVSMVDSADSDLTPYFTDVTDFIDEQICANKRVLVHCQGGINRSPTFVIAYLAKHHMSLQEAIALVTCRRPAARIQPHYMAQIERWLSEVPAEVQLRSC